MPSAPWPLLTNSTATRDSKAARLLLCKFGRTLSGAKQLKHTNRTSQIAPKIEVTRRPSRPRTQGRRSRRELLIFNASDLADRWRCYCFLTFNAVARHL
jgi:hypothetical protein